MRQTLSRRRDQLDGIFADYGQVIADECHHIPAQSFVEVVKRSPARYVLGLTATPYRNDGLDAMIAMHCGPTRHQVDTAQTPAAQELRFELVVHETDLELDTRPDVAIHEVFAGLARNAERTRAICRDVAAAAQRGRRCLVLTERRDHLEELTQRLTAAGCDPHVLVGGTGRRARAEVLERVDALDEDEGFVLVATGRYIGEGFDCPVLDTLFLAFPISFRGRVVQYTGRILRPAPGKRTARVHDYADVRVPVLARMFDRRLTAYDRIGFERVPDR